MKFDLKSMTRKELEKLAADVKKALQSAKARDRREAIKAAEKAAAEFGFSLTDLSDEKPTKTDGRKKRKKSAPAKPRFANPSDAAQTWTGKGRQPFWYKKAIDGGATPESLEI